MGQKARQNSQTTYLWRNQIEVKQEEREKEEKIEHKETEKKTSPSNERGEEWKRNVKRSYFTTDSRRAVWQAHKEFVY